MVFLIVLVFLHDLGISSAGEAPLAADCVDRVGGAFVTLAGKGDFSGTTLVFYNVTVWSTHDGFIDGACKHLKENTSLNDPSIPMFHNLVDGVDCDPQWSWHVHPTLMSGWAELATEVCDATPRFIEGNKIDWIASDVGWCPWSVSSILKVDDRRKGVAPTIATSGARTSTAAPRHYEEHPSTWPDSDITNASTTTPSTMTQTTVGSQLGHRTSDDRDCTSRVSVGRAVIFQASLLWMFSVV